MNEKFRQDTEVAVMKSKEGMDRACSCCSSGLTTRGEDSAHYAQKSKKQETTTGVIECVPCL